MRTEKVGPRQLDQRELETYIPGEGKEKGERGQREIQKIKERTVIHTEISSHWEQGFRCLYFDSVQ